MNDNLKALINKIIGDKELRTNFKAITDPDEAYKLASSVQPGFTREEFISTMAELKNSMNILKIVSMMNFKV